jgi:geranylgeranyl diphosphate synthase type I
MRHAPRVNRAGSSRAGDILAIMPDRGAVAYVSGQVGRVLAEFTGRQRALAGSIAAEMLPAVDAVAGLLSGGKRLRAAFCYWGWRGAGGADCDGILTAAAALELLHASALVHDDVLDDSDTRRGRPSLHRVFAARHAAEGWRGSAEAFGRGSAILLGDLLLAWSDELFGGSGLDPAVLARGRPVLDVMRTEVMAGQYLDLLEQAGQGGGMAGALRVVRYKTAKYTVERPLHLGAALASADHVSAEHGSAGHAGPGSALAWGYSGYGLPLGMAFQLRDDVLGVFGDPAETGKPAGDDIRAGKRTVLAAMAREKATPAQVSALDRLLGDPAIGADGIAEFRGLLTSTGALAECEAMIDRYVTEALAVLDTLPVPAEARAALAELTAAATARRG